MNKIFGFTDKYRFLSNFHPSPLDIGGFFDGFMPDAKAPTVEHAYQATKTSNREIWAHIITAPTPGQAKKLGREIPKEFLIARWDEKRYDIMRVLVRGKFNENHDLAMQLIQTGDAELVEANWWGDSYWGVDRKTGKGENMLGKILMEARKDINAAVLNAMKIANQTVTVSNK